MCSQPTPRYKIGAQQPLFHLSVCAPGHRSSISAMVQSLMEVVKETESAAGREFEVEIALQEALANAVVHGCRNDPAKVVECELSCRGAGELVIVVRDPGPGFDLASVPNPIAEENVHSTHGRGIYLIRQLMDEAWFDRGGSEIHMVLKQADPSRHGSQAMRADVWPGAWSVSPTSRPSTLPSAERGGGNDEDEGAWNSAVGDHSRRRGDF